MKASKKVTLLREAGWAVFADGRCTSPDGKAMRVLLREAWAIYLAGKARYAKPDRIARGNAEVIALTLALGKWMQ
jgi:hypothetical protein